MQREKEEEVKAVEETNKKKELEERARQEYDKVGAEGVGRGRGGGGGIHKARKWRERSTERGVEEEGKHVHTFTRTCVRAFLEWFTVSTLLLL